MLKQAARIVLAGCTIVAALSLASPMAMAVGTWTVTGGPAFTASTASGTTFTLTDRTNDSAITCTVATAKGNVTDQSSSANTRVASVTSSTFGDSAHKCSGPLGSTGTITQKPGTTATLNALLYGDGLTTGDIDGADLVLTLTSILGTCSAQITGTAGFSYINTSHLLSYLTVDNDLQVISTSSTGFGCSGIIQVDNEITLRSGTGGVRVDVSIPLAPIQISQP